MDEDIAPPVKKRRLSGSTYMHLHRDHSTASPDAQPSFSHSVKSLYAYTHSKSTPALPRPTAEVQGDAEQAALRETVDFHELLRRQGIGVTVSVSLGISVSLPSLPTGIQTFTDATTTLTYTPPETPSLPTLPSISGATTFSTTETTTTAAASSSISISSISSSASSITTSISSSSEPSTTASTSNTATTTNTLTTSHTLSAAAFGGNRTTTSKTRSSSVNTGLIFVATLSDGDVTTITRSGGAYTTTLSDGEVFTVFGSNPQGRLTVTSTLDVSAAGNGGSTPTSSASSTTTAGLASSGEGTSSTPPAGTIAGGVVGGCAGLAVVVLIAMLLVRWYRRSGQAGHRALPRSAERGYPDIPSEPRPPGMAERAGLMPFVATVPAFFRHQNHSSTGPSESSERGFTRVSGRKLPSAFSDGMTSAPHAGMPLTSTTFGSSEDRDFSGVSYYSGEGARQSPTSPTLSVSPESSGPLRNHSGHESMMMSPGPQRQPQLHAGGPYSMPPPGYALSPGTTAASFQRSVTPSSFDNRSSRFTEDVT